jgi:hypothetical protein
MPKLSPATHIWRALAAVGVIASIYTNRRNTLALDHLTRRVERLAEQVRVDYWRVYADVQDDMLGPDSRR